MIETVLGPIPASQLGRTSTNEHLLTDSRHLLRSLYGGGHIEGPVRLEALGELQWNWLASSDNLTLDDVGTAIAELADARAGGLDSVVEATSWGMGPRHADLPVIARATGIHIVSGYGGYIEKTLPQWWRAMSEAELEAVYTEALTVHVPGTTFKAGLLGLLGTSAEITPVERRSLAAAGRAAAAAGAAVSIRLDAAARLGPAVVRQLTEQGLPAHRILFCNIDKVLDLGYVTEIAGSGAVIEFAFGSEHYFGGGNRGATDRQRIDFLLEVLDAQPTAAVTLSTSVWTKGQLARYGGMGYGHVLRRIVPLLTAGLSAERIDDMLIARPAALLDRTEESP